MDIKLLLLIGIATFQYRTEVDAVLLNNKDILFQDPAMPEQNPSMLDMKQPLRDNSRKNDYKHIPKHT